MTQAFCVLFTSLLCAEALRAQAGPGTRPSTPPAGEWRGVHLLGSQSLDVTQLERAVRERLAPMGVNTIVLEINYNYRYASHPELRSPAAIDREDAQRIARACREHGIRLIPMFNCLGHQSWSRTVFPLLAKNPDFEERPTADQEKNLYCRSWCPLHPGVNPVVFALIDELIAAFDADAVHVGMDEVFVIASDACPRCRGKDPADLFARAVNDLHAHLVATRKVTMLMWGDRLLDSRALGYSRWEASANGTAPAIDRIPRDIVMCDWHYDRRADYPSVRFFQDKGFRVWPASWRKTEAALALLECGRRNAGPRMLGHLCTFWHPATLGCRLLLDEKLDPPPPAEAVEAVEAMRVCMQRLRGPLPTGPASAGAVSP